jgi:myo-inositol-1(or 4)-monophosphatase
MTNSLLPAHLAARLNFAIALARQCGALAVKEAAQLQISAKGAHDVLTQADLAVEQLIRAEVAKAFAGDLVVGEEMGGQDAVGGAGNFWLVDPIDGTANYATDVPRWCISIGYLEAGQPVLGVLFDPLMDRLYSAGRGAGARLNDRPIQARSTGALNGATVELGWSPRSQPAAYLGKAAALLAAGCAFTRRGSGALGLADVAAGRVDGYAELHINAWDCAAGILLVTEAGGLANDFFTPQGIRSGGLLVACAADLYPALHGLMAGTP